MQGRVLLVGCLFGVLAAAQTGEWYTSEYFSDSGCTMAVANSATVFESGACLNDPGPPTGQVRSARFTFLSTTTLEVAGDLSTTDCSVVLTTFPINNCYCQNSNGGTAPYNYYKVTPVGNGTAVCAPPTTTAQPTTTPAPVCFHESTTVEYGGRPLTLAQLAHEPDCRIPHQPISSGVRIEATNGKALRLTPDHLVFTARGLVAAGDVVVGDHLFTALDETASSEVTAVHAEHGQRYFGLNCLESTVLANGFKTSTVGYNHAIPSLWFKYAGHVLGIERASRMADWVAHALFKLRILQ